MWKPQLQKRNVEKTSQQFIWARRATIGKSMCDVQSSNVHLWSIIMEQIVTTRNKKRFKTRQIGAIENPQKDLVVRWRGWRQYGVQSPDSHYQLLPCSTRKIPIATRVPWSICYYNEFSKELPVTTEKKGTSLLISLLINKEDSSDEEIDKQ